ncbi:MAG: helix-turn-helix domain-containing protein [Candidatus Thermoplasmatota archaeon]|nr:helix-turn-helix domain-containing protein [Candidatus Thermoplasmatota archaeon]
MESLESRDGPAWTDAAEYFKALGYPNRLQLLALLQEPRTLDEIDLSPVQQAMGQDGSRQLTRQGILYHLNQLVDLGIVDVAKTSDGPRIKNRYDLNRANVYGVAELLKDLALGRVEAGAARPEPTPPVSHDKGLHPAEMPHPHMVLVHGLEVGRSFPLNPLDLRGRERGWVIGTSQMADIPLRYDPYLEGQAAEVLHQEGSYEILDLRTSEVRTQVNWVPLERGATMRLEPGDVVGLGRSLLVFRNGASSSNGNGHTAPSRF